MSPDTLRHMVEFVEELQSATMTRRLFGTRGSPWEFNLRDVLRWAHLMQHYGEADNAKYFAEVLFVERMRTGEDKEQCRALLEHFFGEARAVTDARNSDFLLHNGSVYFENRRLTAVGSGAPREPFSQHSLLLLPSQAQTIKSLLMCAEQSQFVLLVGPSGAGKSYVLRCAAELAGVKLMTFSMNASCDTVDLLGGFDQVEGKQGQFEWRDSLVLEAMLQGHWLVLDNVNYCNASVLDRLNPLVEPNGVLSINEQGLVNGEIRVIRPHSNFRVFATLNPKFGEVSRAMRNRAVELYLSPVQIPSQESAVLCRTPSREANAEPSEEALVLKLNRYHKEFVRVAFRANTFLSESIALSDALAAGAPNTFTLLRCCKMLALDSSLEGFSDTLLHCYVKNRSGHWRVHREELEQLLHDIVATSHPDTLHQPSLQDLGDALTLRPVEGHANIDEEEADLHSALVKSRVHRALMALTVALRLQTAVGSESGGAAPAVQDLLLHLTVDQCNDSVPTEPLVQSRVAAIRALSLPQELEQQVLRVLKVQYCHSSMLPELFCRALEVLGPHALLLSSARLAPSSHFTNSPLVNTAASSLTRGLLEYMADLSSPELFLDVLRVSAPLLQQLGGPENSVHADNYLGVTTNALLVHALLQQQPLADAPRELMRLVESLLQMLEHHLELPFPLMGRPSVLEAYLPSPHITSVEERSAFKTWRSASRLASAAPSGEADTQERSGQLLRPLWSVGAFRSEFHIAQMLLKLATSPLCLQSTTFKLSLRKGIAAFVEEYTQVLKVFTDLEVALWRSVLAIPVADYEFSLPPLVPLLTCCFFTRFPVQDVQCLFSGSWASRAVSCLQFAQQASVLAIGNPHNDNTKTLDGLSTFLSHCRISTTNPLVEMEQSSRQELLRMLQACFPQVRDALQSTVPATSLLEVVRVALGASESKAVAGQTSLITFILASLHDEATCDMGCVMTLLWSLKCRLLLPPTPVDPMLKLECQVKIASEEERLLRRLEEAFEFANAITMRTVDTPQRGLLAQLREREERYLATAKEKCVHRPDPTGAQYAQLVRTLYQLCSTLMSDERLQAITRFAAPDDTQQSVQQSWSVLVYEQVVDVLHRFGGYEDVTLNFAEAALLSAFAMQAHSYGDPATGGAQTLFDRSKSLELMQFPHILVDTVPLPTLTSQRHTLQNHVRYLDSCLLLLRGSCPRGTDPDFVQDLFRSYRYFYQRVEDLEEEERKAEEMAVLYKEKALVIEGDDEKMLRRLKDMFPSYEQEFAEAATTGDEEDEKEKQKESTASAKHTRIMLKEERNDYMQRLVTVHHHFYARLISNRTTPDRVAFSDVLEAFRQRFDVVTKDVARLAGAPVPATAPGLDENLLIGGFSCRASQLRAQLCAPVESLENRKESGFNIFKDPEPAEVGRFSRPLEALLGAIDKLLVQFPETISLLRCQKIGRKLAALPALTTPLMKLMAGCEVLLRECYEWERNAASEFSLITYMTELSSFVLRWRRLELHCWSHVFKAKQNEYELHACLEWFTLYDLVREEHDDEVTFCINIFHHLSKFMWASCFGDFSTRLRLIEGFAYELVAVHGLCAPCTNTVLHVTSFFAQYSGFVADKCTQAITPIEDDIKDFTKIMRWEDANYYAVRATAEKSHLKMARVLGSLEEVLRTPVLGCITQEEERCEEDTSMGFSLCAELEAADGKKTAVAKKKDGASKKRAREKKKGGKDGKGEAEEEVVAENVLGNWKCDCVAAAHKFFASSADEIINRVHVLQQPKTTEQLKIRALKMLLDTMTENGVPQTHEHQTATWELCFPSFEGLLGFRTVYSDQERLPKLEASTTSYYKFVRWIQRMREAERKPHADLSGAQARRGTGLVETLLSDSITLSTTITSIFQVREKLTTLRLLLEAEPNTEEGYRHASPSVEVLDHCIKQCCHTHALHEALQWMLQHKQVEMGPTEHALLYELLTVSNQLWELCIHYEAVRRSSTYLPEEVARRCIQHLRSITGVAGRLRASESPRIAAAAAALEARTQATLTLCQAGEDGDDAIARGRPEKRCRAEDTQEQWFAQLESALAAAEKGFLDSSIVSSPIAQTAHTSDDGDGAAAEEDASAPSGSTGTYADYRAQLNQMKHCVTEVSASFSALIDSASSAMLLEAKKNGLARRALVLHAFMEDVQDALVVVLREHTHFGVVVARLFTILMKKGFCKSEDETEEQDGDGEGGGQQQGTGMDDGEGEKDVTDQIENEDQLMNMKDKEEQPEKDNKEKDGEDSGEEEDKAADVETDFQGQKETREESDQDEEEGEESDREMGSVDGEEGRDRKRTRKDNTDANDMDEDEGDRAEDVPEDEFGNEDERPDEETGNFDNKEDEIRDAEEERDGDHDLVGDDKEMDALSDEREDSLSGDTVEQSDKEGEEREESGVDEELDADALEESVEKESNASDDRHDEEASTDDERSAQGDEREVENDGPSGSDEEAEDASDAPDENVYEGGQQDESTGNEATERNEKERKDNKQPDAAGE
ncbi:midasin [Strigomonas culicis]|uniref:Midasin n=1 Tax=Strigomonas culicis TaxID=28005 RepID=S9UVJ1_9TRYP|nr:midasin [Strigomonas culicis]|eukprot:EPY18521.1 midasin [Strigomonas culicis]